MNKYKLYLIVLLLVAFVVQGCVVTPPAAKDAQTLTVLVYAPPTTLDPAVNYEQAGEPFLAPVYDGLVRVQGDTGSEIIPWLAETWEQSPDGLTYTFHLREGVKFHDGTLVNAEAVKFSFERMLEMNSGAVANYTVIDKIEAVDDLTVRFTLKSPFSSFMVSLTSLWGPTVVSPTAVREHEVDGDLGQAWLAENEAGSGPYKLESYEHNQQLVLVRNPDYWGGWGDKYVDKVIVRFVSESTTQRQMIEKGDADLAIGLSTEDLDALMETPGVVVPEYTAQTIHEIRLNTTKEPLDDVRVRQALNYSFDYEQAVQGIMDGHATAMAGPTAQGLPGFYKPSFTYEYDLEKARALLAEAGYPDGGFELPCVWISGYESDRRMAEMWQADLKKLGIDLKIQEMPLATWWDATMHPETAPATMMGVWTDDYADATMQLWLMYYSGNFPPTGANWLFYKNEQVDKLLEQARAEVDDARRDEYYQEATEIIYTEAPEVWTIQPTERIAMRSNVKGYEYNFAYSSWCFSFEKMYKEQ